MSVIEEIVKPDPSVEEWCDPLEQIPTLPEEPTVLPSFTPGVAARVYKRLKKHGWIEGGMYDYKYNAVGVPRSGRSGRTCLAGHALCVTEGEDNGSLYNPNDYGGRLNQACMIAFGVDYNKIIRLNDKSLKRGRSVDPFGYERVVGYLMLLIDGVEPKRAYQITMAPCE